jgi:tetratricopeptide (TPR) repeat protein
VSLSTPATLSLCMIVRDEAELLPRCLAAVRGLWTELRVVDTGSCDRSVAIVEAEGGRVIHRAWDNDFSAARNAGLEGASGDWIFYLDADEIASAELVAQVGALLADPEAGAATVVMRNLLPHGHRRDTSVLRLFRNHPEVRFSFPIHEDVSAAVQARLAVEGRRLRHLSGAVEHLGYVRERAAARRKKERDSALLLACLERDRADLYSWFKLLELARFWSDRALWGEAAAPALRALEAAGPLALAGKLFGGELVVLCADGLFPGDAAGTLRLIDRWADRVDPSAALLLRRGELSELTGASIAAAADFTRCCELGAVTADQQLTTVRPLMGLARLALSVGDNREAWRRVEQALAHGPRDPEALLLAVLLCRARGGEPGERDFADAHRAAHGDCAELHQALGEAALAARRPAAAVVELERAAGQPPHGRIALRLAQALLAAGDVEGTRRLCAALTPGLPEAALGILMCDLVTGLDSDLTLDIDDETANRALRSWADLLRGSAPPVMLESLRRAAPALVEVFPWLPSYLGPPAGIAARGAG